MTSSKTRSEILSESMAKALDGRRILMLAADAAIADDVERVLRETCIAVVRPDLDEEMAELPHGHVILVDGSRIASGAVPSQIAAILDASRLGSTRDHVLAALPNESSDDSFNRIMDRLVEAGIVDDMGGIAQVPPAVRRYMTWLPAAEVPAGAEHLHTGTVHESGNLVENDDFASGIERWPIANSDQMWDAFFDRMMGDFGSRRGRDVLIIRNENQGHDMVSAIDLPKGGFDHRAENEAYNRRRTRGGSRNR